MSSVFVWCLTKHRVYARKPFPLPLQVTCTAVSVTGTLITILNTVTLCTHTETGFLFNPAQLQRAFVISVMSVDISFLTSVQYDVMVLLALH